VQGDAQLVLVTRFTDAVEVEAALEGVVGAWCGLKASRNLDAEIVIQFRSSELRARQMLFRERCAVISREFSPPCSVPVIR